MLKKLNAFFLFACLSYPTLIFSLEFIIDKTELTPYLNRTDCIMVASCGRSGSSMLAYRTSNNAKDYTVIKTHMLPPCKEFTGKILFIYSNPDKAAESVLHIMMNEIPLWGYRHFRHMEASDPTWLEKIEDPTKQTEQHNLLASDALGYYQQLNEWLVLKTHESHNTPFESQILAIKYENLWDKETVEALQEFLGIIDFKLPAKRERGYQEDKLLPMEIAIRKLYNQGTWDKPIYIAYDGARLLWERMPPFQFLMRNAYSSNLDNKTDD